MVWVYGGSFINCNLLVGVLNELVDVFPYATNGACEYHHLRRAGDVIGYLMSYISSWGWVGVGVMLNIIPGY
jgi:hypothetical protein